VGPDTERAIAELVRLQKLDLSVRLPMPPMPSLPPGVSPAPAAPQAPDGRIDALEEIIEAAGPGVVPALEAALPQATGSGRVAILLLVNKLQPERGRALVRAACDDTTPAAIYTCLCRIDSVAAWATDVSSSWERVQAAPEGFQPRTHARSTARRLWWLGALLLLAIGASLGLSWLDVSWAR
jgi:hypothetical protein